MAKGPSWHPKEDQLLNIARQANVSYDKIADIMCWRSAMACRVRANVLRRERGEPSRDYEHLERLQYRIGTMKLETALAGYGRSR